MSEENVELVKVVHKGWAQGDFRAGAELFSPDYSWEQHAEAVEPGSRRGAAIGNSLRNMFAVYDDYRIEAEEFIDGGDEVVVLTQVKGTAKGSQMELNQFFALVWSVRGGSLVRLRVFTDRDSALEAAGLSE
jgi:ketosteroid isomerase-like protein